jgi:hypothetical protein
MKGAPMADQVQVQIPSQAVSLDGADLCPPVRGLLEGLDLLGKSTESGQAEGFVSAFTGPPQSVALIEAGATAATKWWAAGLGATVVGIWGSVAAWYGDQPERVQVVVLGGAALVTAALVLAIGHLIASDVRGRAVASVSVIQARAKVATSMVEAARDLYAPAEPAPPQTIPLPGRLRARNLDEHGDARKGWLVVAMERHADGTISYLLVKGSQQVALPATKVQFNSA